MEANKRQKRIFKKFDPSVLTKRGSSVLIIGRRASGKSQLILDLINKTKLPSVIISREEECTSFYTKNANCTEVHYEYEPQVIANVIVKQHIERIEHTEPTIGVVIDDCYDRKIWKGSEFYNIIMNSRHHRLNVIMSLQYLFSIPPIIRSNIDYLFYFRGIITSLHKKLYDNFFGHFATFQEFLEVYHELTEDYGCIVVDNTTRSTNIEDIIFYYKVDSNNVSNAITNAISNS